MPTSAIANWQHALRPTMTHRANHLASLGLIVRTPGVDDRRNVVCSITDEGRATLESLCSGIRQTLSRGKVLTRIDEGRVKRYLLAMGQYYIQASDLVLIGLSVSDREGVPIALLVGALGLLQPTVSMSVQALEERGLVYRAVTFNNYSVRRDAFARTNYEYVTYAKRVDGHAYFLAVA
jgi:DNA-binding MarR family transcriptional regulator